MYNHFIVDPATLACCIGHLLRCYSYMASGSGRTVRSTFANSLPLIYRYTLVGYR